MEGTASREHTRVRAQQEPGLKPGEGADAGRVLSQDLSRLIRLRKDDAVLNRVYFFPPFAQDMCEALPALHDAGFNCTTEDTRTHTGDRISARLQAPDGAELQLGTVLLNGSDIQVVDELARVQRVIDFVREHTPPGARVTDSGETENQKPERPDNQDWSQGMGDVEDAYSEQQQSPSWQWWTSQPQWS